MKRPSFYFAGFFAAALLSGTILIGCDVLDPKDSDDDQMSNLADIAGDWIRVESNNPESDFMKLTVTTSQGVITDKAGSGFLDGDKKWNAITPSGIGTFSYQELGSDYNYYDASMAQTSENELEITVSNAGAGNTQKWLRDDGSIVDTTATSIDCKVATDLTLGDKPGPVDYVVDCVVDITAALTIEEGVVIVFKANAGLGVYDSGSLTAIGSADKPIVFKGETDEQGTWRGIHTESDAVLKYVSVVGAGSNYVYCCNDAAAIFAKGGRLTLQNSHISSSGKLGLYVGGDTQLLDFAANTITENNEAPMLISIAAAEQLDGLGSDYRGNTIEYVRLSGGRISTPSIVPAVNIPYLLEGGVLDVTAELTIQAGVDLRVEENGGIGVYDNGSLSLNGTSWQPVRIAGKENIRGYWRGIHIETTSEKNQFSYATISDAGADYVYCCNLVASIFLKNGSLNITNSTIANGNSYGLYANASASLQFSSNTIETHKEAPLYLAVARVSELDGMGSNYLNNDVNYIGVFDSNADEVITWPKTQIPYLIDGFVMNITKGMSMEAGTEIVFKANAGLGVYDEGYLSLLGTEADGITLRGLDDSQGYWRGIHTETTSANNVISYTSVLHAGSNYVYCCNEKAALKVKGGTMELKNSSINDSGGCGVYVSSSAVLTESNNTFSNNADGNVCN